MSKRLRLMVKADTQVCGSMHAIGPLHGEVFLAIYSYIQGMLDQQ